MYPPCSALDRKVMRMEGKKQAEHDDDDNDDDDSNGEFGRSCANNR